MSKKILILGCTSAIARRSSIEFARQGAELYLASRDSLETERIAADIRIRFNTVVHTGNFAAETLDMHQAFFDQVIATLDGLNGVLLATGTMDGNAEKILITNFNGPVSILNKCADYFSKQKQGFIIGISSVAGDRGRQSNYLYGSAKGALSLYLQGLRNRLFKDNVRVITIKPGFVDTAMTFGLPGLFLVASPEFIGKKIANSIHHKKDVLYLPWFWLYIMLIIKSIPEFIFKRLSL